jgi:acyl-CoA synthetase (AMP-forming)/AMP-acid ligase II
MSIRSVNELVQRRADSHGEARAYTFLQNGEDEAAQLSYAELDRESRVVAAALQDIASPCDRVLLMYPPGLDFITGFLGCLYAGAIAVPAYAPNPARPERYMARLAAIAASAQAGIILTTGDQARKLPELMHGLEPLEQARIVETDALPPALAENCTSVSAHRDTLALLQYTSGSTSEPKGVMVTHGNILHNLEFIRQREANDEHSVSVTWLPSFHDMGLLEGILSPLYGAYPLYLMSPLAFVQRPVRWLNAISKYHASNSGGPNFAYDYCTRAVSEPQREGLDLSSWRVAYNGAETVHMETLRGFADAYQPYGFNLDAFCPVYGLAESTALAAATQRGDGPVSRPVGGTRKQAVSCGVPDARSRLLVVDPERRLQCAPGEEGEIWLAGPSIARGYWNNPEQTARVFNAFLADTGGGPFLRSGDLGFVVDGTVYITGRIKDLIILRGRKLFPQDIEYSVAHAHPLIREHGVAAFSTDDGQMEQLVVIAELNLRRLRKTESGETPPADASPPDFLRIALDLVETIFREHEARVSTALLVPPGQIARTSSGKIQRFTCRERFLSGSLETLFRWEPTAGLHPCGAGA